MWALMSALLPVLLPTLIVRSVCDNDTNSDVFVHYSGHADAITDVKSTDLIVSTEISSQTTTTTTPTEQPTTVAFGADTESIVFIPNEAPVVRLEDGDDRNKIKLQQLIDRRDMADVMNNNFAETEAPKDVVFIVDKNLDQMATERYEKSGRRRDSNHQDTELDPPKQEKRPPTPKLDCKNLDCDNDLDSICGGKIINKKWHYRHFMNDCYFRKVNCNFKFEVNRYMKVPITNCPVAETIGDRQIYHNPTLLDDIEYRIKSKSSKDTRRSLPSRRSMTINVNGQYCSHLCPISCPEDYEPECAVDATGKHRMFVNHCKMDENSCTFGVVWHKRPLSACVGGRKADMRQNRFFIGWMQRVGIVDNKGKLVLE